VNDTAGITTLNVEQVTQIIFQAKTAGDNPRLVGVHIFSSLGDNVTLLGATLALALANSGIPIPESLSPLVNAVQSLSKAGGHVSIALAQDTEVLVNKTRLRFGKEVGFDVGESDGDPALKNMVGVAAHKLLSWINIQSLQLKQNQGRWTVTVGTPLTTINVDLS
jgi:hypothetical protein